MAGVGGEGTAPPKSMDHRHSTTLHAPFLLGLDTNTSKVLMVWLFLDKYP